MLNAKPKPNPMLDAKPMPTLNANPMPMPMPNREEARRRAGPKRERADNRQVNERRHDQRDGLAQPAPYVRTPLTHPSVIPRGRRFGDMKATKYLGR